MNKLPAVFNWSTGKDSALALYLSLQEGWNIHYLLTTVSEQHKRVTQHGVRERLLEKQAEAIGIPLRKVWLPADLNMEIYSEILKKEWQELKKISVHSALFGDIHLEHLRQYREDQLNEISIASEFPLWNRDTKKLAKSFIDKGFKAVVVNVNDAYLDQSFAGRLYNRSFLNDLPKNVDPCGEQGEFHTFVYDGPIFGKAIKWDKGRIIYRKIPKSTNHTNDREICTPADEKNGSGIWFCDLISPH